MSVRALGTAFASELHRAALKARGFKKSGNTFCIERDGYAEILQIQGSSWNSGTEPWSFYVNVRVRFNGLPSSPVSQGLPYDADGRIERIVPEAPHRFDLTTQNFAETVTLLSTLIEKLSIQLPNLLEPVRKRATLGLVSPLPVPATWQEEDSRKEA